METTVSIHPAYLPLKIRHYNLQKPTFMNTLWACHSCHSQAQKQPKDLMLLHFAGASFYFIFGAHLDLWQCENMVGVHNYLCEEISCMILHEKPVHG